MKIANRNSSEYTSNKLPFKGSNLIAIDLPNVYVVYSYGWYPLFVYAKDADVWYFNESRYSVSTRRQYGQARPRVNAVIQYVTIDKMKEVLEIIS